jgi:diphosphomevalonate decarboxylase
MSMPENHEGRVEWECPSNIALVKYWGKHGQQLPNNCSISFTLKEAKTITSINYKIKSSPSDTIDFTFSFEGKVNPKFAAKISKYFKDILSYFPFLTNYFLVIESRNTFPHSAGIASSASAMGALALCLCDLETICTNKSFNASEFLEKASFIARLGSGSACRSLFPHIALWGAHPIIPFSSDEYAIPFEAAHPIYYTFRDTILIVSGKEKSVSSRAGHALMDTNKFASIRYIQANDNIERIVKCLISGNLMDFGAIVEEEALSLHALMMTSEPSFILIQPNTLAIIQEVRNFRSETSLPLFFTLDAGPNVHLLYPANINEQVLNFIENKLLYLCEGNYLLHDYVGIGIKQIE